MMDGKKTETDCDLIIVTTTERPKSIVYIRMPRITVSHHSILMWKVIQNFITLKFGWTDKVGEIWQPFCTGYVLTLL